MSQQRVNGMYIFLHVSGNGPGKLLDPRKKMVERIVRFGDSPNVSINIDQDNYNF